MVDALCIGTHPDDVELAMGGTVAGMVRQGLRVVMLDLTDGEPTPEGTRETRLPEARAAATALGVSERRLLDLPNRTLEATLEARVRLAEEIRELQPRVIFAPYPVDAHPDHVAASALVDAARFHAKLTKTDMRAAPHWTPRLYHYAPVHVKLVLEPAFIVDVSADFARKMEAMRCYATQFVKNTRNAGVPRALEVQAAYFGQLIGVAYGEPFFSRERIGIGGIGSLL